MAQSSLLVSVIVPTYNAERYLDQCLDSIEAQTYRNLEVICLNDGSTDGSLEVMRVHAAKDRRIRVIDKQNQGYGATCNRGLAEAQGAYISIIEPDDWIEPRMYEDMLRFASRFEGPLDIVKTAYWRIVDADTPQQRKLNCSFKGRIHPKTQPFNVRDALHLLRHHPSIWSALYRKSFLDERSIRFKEIPGAGWADNPFLVETLCQTDSIAYLDNAYYCYREETPEKAKAFARKSTLVPFERWHDMMDALQRLNVSDASVLDALYERGFTYLAATQANAGFSQEELREPAASMFERMNADPVFANPAIPPSGKRLFAQLRGLPCPTNLGKLPYLRTLATEGLYSLKNLGPANTLAAMRDFLRKPK